MTTSFESAMPQPGAQGTGQKTTQLISARTAPAPAHAAASLSDDSNPSPAASSGHHPWLWALVALVLCAIALAVVAHFVRLAHVPPPAKPVQPTPVVCAKAHSGDLPIYLSELGTVTPLATVTLRSRVDGEIERVCFTEGQIVEAGDPLFEIDKRPYVALEAQAKGQLARDKALLENARIDYKRYQQGGVVFTDQQLVTQKALVEQYVGILQSDQGLLDTASLQVTYCTITAPVSGRIGLRLVDKGNIIHAADAAGFAVITTLQPITVVFTIRQDDIPVVRQHQTGSTALSVEAYSRDLGTLLGTGTLLAVDNQVDPGSGTVRLKAQFDNADNALFPNQFVNIRLKLETLHNVMLVPTAAIQLSPERAFAYVVGADDTISAPTITPAQSEGGYTVVSGLEDGMRVVTDGVDKLNAGTKVVITEAKDAQKPNKAASPGDDSATHSHANDKTTAPAPGDLPSTSGPAPKQ